MLLSNHDLYGGLTALHVSVAASLRTENCLYSLGVVDCLLNSKADVNAKSNSSSTALHLAVEEYSREPDYFEIVKHLIAAGADLTATDVYQDTPLHCAARDSSLAIIECLVEAGADVNAENSQGDTPLHLAAKDGFDLSCPLRVLLREDGICPSYANVSPAMDVLRYLISAGADSCAPNNDNEDALICAENRVESSIVMVKEWRAARYGDCTDQVLEHLRRAKDDIKHILRDENNKFYLAATTPPVGEFNISNSSIDKSQIPDTDPKLDSDLNGGHVRKNDQQNIANGDLLLAGGR